jgi:nucleoside-diphosphate-sugar epimerase
VILVTGGSGFVGRHLIKALCGTEAVRVFTRSASSVAGIPDVDVAVGDLTDAAAVERAVDGVRAIIHLAARVAENDHGAADAYAMNVHATSTLASASRAAGVEQFIHLSSGGIYGNGRTSTPHRETDRTDPGNAYERSKLAAEEVLNEQLSHGRTTFTMLRSAGIYGHGRPATRAFFEEVRRRRYWIHGSPNVLVHPTHVADVVQACRLVLDRPHDSPAVVNIAGERAVRFQEYVALVAAALDVPVRQWVVPSRVGPPAARVAARAIRLVGAPVPAIVDRLGRRWVNRALDISLAEGALGFRPISLRDGLRETAEAMLLDPRSS